MLLLNFPVSVFLDTNIFMSAKYDFSVNGVLYTLLKQINDGKINLYISNIVQQEVEKHIEEEFFKLSAIFKRASRDSTEKISPNLIKEMQISFLFNKLDKEAIKNEAISIFNKFIVDSKAIILDSSNVDCNRIVYDYFSGNPPFEIKDNKKHEFPDAIMAVKLKTVFNDKNPVCIISNDLGFKNSFKNEKGFTMFSSLKEVLNLINNETQIYDNITSFIRSSSVHKEICDKIADEIENKDLDIDGMDCDRKGFCEGYEYEEVYIDDISQVDFEFSSVDDITADEVKLTLSTTASISATCSYFDEASSAWDSEEKEYVFSVWGTMEEKHQPKFDCEVIFLIERSDEDVTFDMKEVKMDILLDQRTRVERKPIFYDK